MSLNALSKFICPTIPHIKVPLGSIILSNTLTSSSEISIFSPHYPHKFIINKSIFTMNWSLINIDTFQKILDMEYNL